MKMRLTDIIIGKHLLCLLINLPLVASEENTLIIITEVNEQIIFWTIKVVAYSKFIALTRRRESIVKIMFRLFLSSL